ncbi:hypothetical protein [Spirochaeta africana]|uniref:DUF5723 domain-containing protein n=1 Tax=Spirochaeta africana (strain ATCC 700263 / DSM 8902 / Z-7692) TaxID=889378 RepID=H9UL42_SPIAZ|nr:hypothetical protein [Spirochaeta africana]AFG38235.1 hypothetical protein Spiaf_2199 [Spirochaeta africana DSM 8902]
MYAQPQRLKLILLCAVLGLTVAVAAVHADTVVYHPELAPRFPSVEGQGGVMALQGGLPSLFGNPAAAGRHGSGLHLYSLGWSTVPFDRLIPAWQRSSDSDNRLAGLLLQLESGLGGRAAGGGYLAGVARTGTGFNTGLMLTSQLIAVGDNLEEMAGALEFQISAHFGWVQEFQALDSTWTAGGQVRPMIRTHTPLAGESLFMLEDDTPVPREDGLDGLPSLSGITLALDGGITWQRDAFSAGLYGRNLSAPAIDYTLNSYGEVRDELMDQFGIPSRSTASSEDRSRYLDGIQYRIPATAGVGVAWDPVIPDYSYLINPAFQLEYRTVFDGEPMDPWYGLHAGGQVEILQFLRLWGGWGQGQISGGIGARFWLIEIAGAWYSTQGRGAIGAEPLPQWSQQGFSLEIGLRL